MEDAITTLLSRAMSRGVPVPAPAAHALRGALANHGAVLSDQIRQAFLDQFLEGLKSIVAPEQGLREGAEQTVTEGETPTSLVGNLTKLLGRVADRHAIIEDMNLDFKIDVATNVMRGGARLISQNYDQDELDEFPALELLRVYDRDVPRGFKRGAKGSLIPVPDDDWPSRWVDACKASGDDAALRVFNETGRMIALKSSGVWAELGSNRDDTLGNPFPPFAFNSGYDVDGVPRKETIALGLMDEGDKAERADVDWENLFSLAE